MLVYLSRNKWLDFGDVLADTDEMQVLAHAPATTPLGGGLRSSSASSLVNNIFFKFSVELLHNLSIYLEAPAEVTLINVLK